MEALAQSTHDTAPRFETAKQREIYSLINKLRPLNSRGEIETARTMLYSLQRCKVIDHAKFQELLAWITENEERRFYSVTKPRS